MGLEIALIIVGCLIGVVGLASMVVSAWLAVKYHVETLERMWHNEYGLGQVLPKTYFELKELWEQQAKLKQTVTEDNIHKEEKVMIGRRSPMKRRMLSLD